MADLVSFTFINNCDRPIWPAMSQNHPPLLPQEADPFPQAKLLAKGASVVARVPRQWDGRVWAREYCQDNGANCLIGDCSAPSCWTHSSAKTTLLELSTKKNGTYYDLSLGMKAHMIRVQYRLIFANLREVDAYTTGISIEPSVPECRSVSCTPPVGLGLDGGGKTLCPEPNLIHVNGTVSGCLSMCALTNSEEHCCTGEIFSKRGACKASSEFMKKACSNSYSWPHDDLTSTAFCGNGSANFTVSFSCPSGKQVISS